FETADAFRRPDLMLNGLEACLYFICTDAACYDKFQDVALRNNAVNTPSDDLCTLTYRLNQPWGSSYRAVVASLAAAASVDAKELVKQGFKGIEVGKALRKARLEAIHRTLA